MCTNRFRGTIFIAAAIVGSVVAFLIAEIGSSWALPTGGIIAAAIVLAIQPGVYLLLGLVLYGAMQSVLSSSAATIGGVNLSQLWIGILSAGLLVRVALKNVLRGGLKKPSAAVIAHLVFFAWATIRTIHSPGTAASVSVLRVGASIIISYVAYDMALSYGMWFLLSVGSVSIIAGITAAFDATRSRGPQLALMADAVRAAGSFGGPVATATVALVGLPVFLYFLLRKGRARVLGRAFAIIGFVSLILAGAFTLTRTMFVGVVIFAAFLLLLDESSSLGSRQRRFLVAAIPVIVFLGAIRAAPSSYVEARLQDVPGLGSGASLTSNAGSGRGLIWTNTLEMLLDSTPWQWLVGHGTAAVRDDLQKKAGIFKNAHNSYLEVIYDLGVVGLILYLALLYLTFHDIVPYPRSHDDKRWRVLGRAYFLSYCLSTIMFNGYVFAVGPRWFTYMLAGLLTAGSPTKNVFSSSDCHEANS